ACDHDRVVGTQVASAGAVAVSEKRASLAPPPSGRGARMDTHGVLEVLVVDDEPGTRLTLAAVLEESGHRVTDVADGTEASALLRERVFDVAICDVRLPGMSGLDLFRQVRAESPTTAVILMTAYASVQDAVAALHAGAFDYVTKPFDPE